MKVLLMLVGVFGGSLIGSVIGRLLGIDGVYTVIGSIIGAIGMYWLWRKYVDDDENLESSQGGNLSRRTGSNDRAELLHEMLEERRRARIGRHRRNDDD